MCFLTEGPFYFLLLTTSLFGDVVNATNGTDVNGTSATSLNLFMQYLNQLAVPYAPANISNWSEYDPNAFAIPLYVTDANITVTNVTAVDDKLVTTLDHNFEVPISPTKPSNKTYTYQSSFETFKQYKDCWYGLFAIGGIVAAIIICKKNKVQGHEMQLRTVTAERETLTPTVSTPTVQPTPFINDSQHPRSTCSDPTKEDNKS